MLKKIFYRRILRLRFRFLKGYLQEVLQVIVLFGLHVCVHAIADICRIHRQERSK